MNDFTMCSQCIYWEECENKESRDGCYFGEEEETSMRLWIDDVRPAPEGYIWFKSVNLVKEYIGDIERTYGVELIDIDHDAGDYACDGGDYIKLLDWLEETGRNYPIRIHSMNPVGRQNMLAICQKNGWKVVY